MKIIRKIALTELQTLFYSPVAWLILIVFTFQCAMAFTDALGMFVRNQEMNYPVGNLTLNLFGGQRGLFTQVQGYLYLYIPLLTMGLMSRELSSGSIRLLYSSPVTNAQIILGKFVSMMVYGLILTAILFVFVIWDSFAVKDFDFPLALSGLLGLYMLVCAYAAIGLFMSSLTSYQVVAAMGTLAILSVLNFVGGIGQSIDFVREITYWLSIGGRAGESINGLICSEDILYFVIVSALFLSLSILRLKALRQKARWQVSFSKYVGVFVLAMLLGYITSRPMLMFFHDATHTKQRTLTENSQEIIKRAEGGLTMTTYVNILDGNYWAGLPRNKKNDINRFAQYIRFKPEMKMKYVYYYANTGDPNMERRYPGLSDIERVGKISKAENIDSMMFKPLEEIPKQVDLSPEGFRLVRLLERANGQKTFLRMFDDMQRYPSETEISAAFKRLVMELPVVGFVAGHGERDFFNEGDRGYYRFSQDKPFRYALVNQGFDCEEAYLNSPIPAHINILVIADMRRPLVAEEEAHLEAYIARGGNLIILGDTRRQGVMNPLAERFGVQFMPGQLVKYVGAQKEEEKEKEKEESVVVNGVEMRVATLGGGGTVSGTGTAGAASFSPQGRGNNANNFPADFIQSRLSKEGSELNYIFEQMYRGQNVVTMPGCVGLSYRTDKGYQVVPLLVSDPKDSWNELETTNFIDDTVKINAAIGEIERSYPTALALTRQVNGKEQKIMIVGDADCISNGEISMQRPRVPAANFNMMMASFYWMSDEEVPIDVRRPTPPDNRLLTTGSGVKMGKWILQGAFPALLLAICLILWLRRRGR